MKWEPIEKAKPDGKMKVLYFPPLANKRGERTHSTHYTVDKYPDPFPRKATYFILLPDPPESEI